MARIRIELPERFVYHTSVYVRVTDMNYGAHMGNEVVLIYAHEARARFLHSTGYSERDVEGLGIIVTDAAVVYRTEAFFGDRVAVSLGLADFNKYGCDVVYRLVNEDTNREIARAKTGIVFFDYLTRRIARAPAGFVTRFTADHGPASR